VTRPDAAAADPATAAQLWDNSAAAVQMSRRAQ